MIKIELTLKGSYPENLMKNNLGGTKAAMPNF